ncbi:unnamed protein product [Paramecium sonneborni]|uniref:Transmembrane protein n=1 Tax=Paramecium sonneborni TaxID=65129 RepID=A0A8S1L139_9CILI|nr:unnamed protein product [Paramecium sonneborni]
MNKYTLQFRDATTESKFRQQAADSVQIPTFKFCAYSSILYFVVSLIFQIIKLDVRTIITRVIAVIMLMITLLIVKKNKGQVNKGLVIINLLIAAFEYEQDDSYDELNYYLYGCNTMLIHTIIIFTQSFNYAVVSNFAMLVIRLSVTGLYTKISYIQLVVAFITTFGFIIILYQSEKFQRSSFLMTLKDNSWEIMLPFILTKPFLVFTFDQDQFSYQLKMINKLGFPFENNNIVHQFLKDAKYGNSTLQEYIYFQIISCNPSSFQPFVQELQIIFKKKKIQLLISGCYLGQPNFIIVFQSEDKDIRQMQKLFYQQHQMYLKYFLKHIRQTCKFLKSIVEQNQINLAIKLLISHKQSLLFEDQNLKKLKNINPHKTIDKLCNYFRRINFKIKFTNTNFDEILTIKPCFLMFLYEIFKNMDRNQIYHLKSFQSNKQYIIFLIGMTEYPKTNLFQFCTKCLIEQIVEKDNSIKLNKLGLQFVFLDTPLISYYKSNIKAFANPYE